MNRRTTKKSTARGWEWWGEPIQELRLRHAVRLLEAAGEIETAVYEPAGRPLDRTLQRYQRSRPKMGRNDRLLVGTAVYRLARNRELYRDALPAAAVGKGQLLVLALLDALPREELGRIPHLPGGVRPWDEGLRRLARLRTDGVRRATALWGESAIRGAEDGDLCRLLGVPDWWLADGPWATVGEAVTELACLKRPQHLTLRCQAHLTDRDPVLDELRRSGVRATATPRSPWGVVVADRYNVLATDLYRSGRVEVQDEGSQLAACLCDPKPGERVLDLCAGGGGKSLALAAALDGRGEVVAHDADPSRLLDLRRRARRSQLGNIRILEDGNDVEARGPYALVMADVPCTSSGTLRRNPDVAWRWNRTDQERLLTVQAAILDRAAALVAPGGHLVYVTCSLLPAENLSQIEAFQARHPGFSWAAPGDRRAHGAFRGVPGAERGAFRLPCTLERYAGDAFFLARLVRRTG